MSVLFGVKVLPDLWPYYASALDKNDLIVSVVIACLFVVVAMLNGIIIERILNSTNGKYLEYKKSVAVL